MTARSWGHPASRVEGFAGGLWGGGSQHPPRTVQVLDAGSGLQQTNVGGSHWIVGPQGAMRAGEGVDTLHLVTRSPGVG